MIIMLVIGLVIGLMLGMTFTLYLEDKNHAWQPTNSIPIGWIRETYGDYGLSKEMIERWRDEQISR